VTEHIGIYRVERPIGRGGMGEVLLAWDDRLERRVAVKRIRRDAGLSAEQRERFRREARLAARLSHPAVVQIYDLVTGDADDAIVMEYVEGETLAERVKAGALPMGEVLRLAQEIAEGLAAAHEAGLIHRDLKSANVIVTRAGRAKILDFGLARPASRRSDELPLTQQGFVIGTLHAMSPEQARGEELDQRSDLFSLGVLLYEMLTGETPFRAAEPAATLRRIVLEPPPDVRSLRPDLPAEVESLLGRLLAKNRQDRPDSAAEVAAILERLRTGSGSRSLTLAGEGSVSDLPTSVMPEGALRPISSHREPFPSSLVGTVGRSGRKLWIAAAAAVLIAAVAMAVFLARPRPPLRIAVAPVKVVAPVDEKLSLAGSGVLTAELASLAALEGVAAIEPREDSGGGGSPVDMARANAVDEVLTSEIQRAGKMARVTLRRLQGSDGRVLWTETFPVPIDSAGLRELADAVAMPIQKAYSDHDLRPGVPVLDVRAQDYATFLEIKQRIDTGVVPPEPELEKLEEIVLNSPRFLEAQIVASRLALNLFQSRREKAYLDRASELVREAKKISPGDPRPLRQELQIALSMNRLDEAQAILTQLEHLLPGDPVILTLRGRLAEQQGRLDEAAELQTAAVDRAPSWQNLHRLAQLEARRGRIDKARSHIETILRQSPDNTWALEALGELELYYGDLARAEQIYKQYSTSAPQRSLTNLGVARFFSGRYREAADAYRRALALEPNRIIILVNLADAESELGRVREAQDLYQRSLSLLEESERTVGLIPLESMLKAQCLARLGRLREAVELAQAQLRKTPDDPQLLQQIALVHSLAGERTSALNIAVAALDKGVQPRCFAGSAFLWLRETPALRSRFAPP
jgi:serine/threonine protein kinase/tetratricopeptide (TPR) repeat protein/TolB-like protein